MCAESVGETAAKEEEEEEEEEATLKDRKEQEQKPVPTNTGMTLRKSSRRLNPKQPTDTPPGNEKPIPESAATAKVKEEEMVPEAKKIKEEPQKGMM